MVELIEKYKYRLLQSLFDLDISSFQGVIANMTPLLKITAFMTEFKLENITWDLSCPDSNHMENGFHLLLPWFDTYELCIAPEWDDIALDINGHSLLLCAILYKPP